MTPSEILDFLASVNYACLVITVSNAKRKLGPGQEKWQQALANMTQEQQQAIEERVKHWRERQGA
jgi:hypothetical protein